MSREITNRLGTSEYIEANPRRLHIFNQNYDQYGDRSNIWPDAWALHFGNRLLGTFETYEKAANDCRGRLAVVV